MTLDEGQVKQVFVTGLYKANAASTARVVVNIGGAGSSKSWTIAQLLIQKFVEEPGALIGISRKTFPALWRWTYALVVRLLTDYGIYARCEHDKTHHVISYKGSELHFFSLDDPTKVRSGALHYLWMEEAIEFTWEDYIAMSLLLRSPVVGSVARRQIFMSLNPTDENSWLKRQLLATEKDIEVIHSTYHDNPYVDKDYRGMLENLINQDKNYYRVYVLGEWGRLENLVLTKSQQIPAMPTEWQAWAYGLDFGFTNATALVKVMLADGKAYLDERLYRTHLTNADLIELLSHEERGDIYADSAEPQRIEEICRAGYNCYPANKDLAYGLDLLKRQPLNITTSSVSLLKEVGGYQYKKDKDGRVLDEVVKFNDHAIDAARYGLAGLVARTGLATASPHVLRGFRMVESTRR